MVPRQSPQLQREGLTRIPELVLALIIYIYNVDIHLTDNDFETLFVALSLYSATVYSASPTWVE